jgi:SOS-response transcriptional repressor LexA
MDTKVLSAIKELLAERRFPTLRELCARTGYSSTSTIHRALKQLEEAKLVEWVDISHGRNRKTLRVLERSDVSCCPRCRYPLNWSPKPQSLLAPKMKWNL